MNSLARTVSALAAPGNRSCDHGGCGDANESGDQIKRVEITMAEEQLRGFVDAGDCGYEQGSGQREAAAAGKIRQQGQHAEQNRVADFIAKPEWNCGQHAEKIFSVAKVRRQRDGEQEHGKAGENKMTGAHREAGSGGTGEIRTALAVSFTLVKNLDDLRW